ncbi:signal peptidase I [Polymorphobacter multimanifer]|uniref:Signal peptidase I n=1 Tax=Polymorphobacter multimanifer TaxID=1070431 RepID=A0A841L9T9_9SPHN|nr:signal peptidase I [Polymorphobacter multimanifer]MBB6227733.1 signal peptidase I [Polymorphobacter multimanifer]
MDLAQARDLHDATTARLRRRLARLARIALFAVVGALVLRALFYAPFSIPSRSMAPSLVPGDTVFVAKWPYGYGVHTLPLGPQLLGIDGTKRLFAHTPGRGEVIVFKTPRDNRTNFIKRVVGLPGDRVEIRQRKLWLNGAPLGYGSACPGEPCGLLLEVLPGPAGRTITIRADAADAMAPFGPVVVPAGMLFLLGDNRGASADSRFPLAEGGIGMVPFANVLGRADIILFSTACPTRPLCRIGIPA